MKENKLWQWFLVGLLVIGGMEIVQANNVRLVGEPVVLESSGSVKEIKLTLEWENSWRDDYNYDAVYIFLKYRCTREIPVAWHPIYLDASGHQVDAGYEYVMAPTGNQNVGIFIQRSGRTNGPKLSRTNVILRWNIASTSESGFQLTTSDFGIDNVRLSCMGIEMVYIPKGPFYLGDKVKVDANSASFRTFRHHTQNIPDDFNLVSTDYKITSFGGVEGTEKLAANRVNDITASGSNAWVGDLSEEHGWTIDFGTKADGTPSGKKQVEVKYIAIESVPGHVPSSWLLQASETGTTGSWEPNTLYSGTAADWNTALECTYPAQKAIKLSTTFKARYYRIVIHQKDMKSGVAPIIKTIAMTDKNIDTDLNYAVLVDGETTALNAGQGISVDDDGDTWNAALPATYTNGYNAFYVMKYELSQEQYVSFLNLISPEGQLSRTVSDLADVGIGEYVFGAHDRVSARNSIIVAARTETTPDTVTFGCSLTGTSVSLDGDGLNIGCGYISPADMLAYADWAGLRPLTEMEYEKMSRRPFPDVPVAQEFAWNTTDIQLPGIIQNPGKSSETIDGGNANYGRQLEGPVRVGAFARSGNSQAQSGSSFWGIVDLSGNLSELYYNLNTPGRKFSEAHGNGKLTSDGNTDLTAWPQDPLAFALRGGNFATASKLQLTTSDRSFAYKTITKMDARDSTVTFRLGRSCPVENAITTVLTLENGVTTASGTAIDTICSGSDYTIAGDAPTGKDRVAYIWYRSENQGKTWEIQQNGFGRDLSLYNLRNAGMEDNVIREYHFKRKVITGNREGFSNLVILRVVDSDYEISRLRDTIDGYDHAAGIRIRTKFPTTFTWSYPAGSKSLTAVEEAANCSYYLPKTADFVRTIGTPNLYGTKQVTVSFAILNACVRNRTIDVEIMNKGDLDGMSVKKFTDENGQVYRAWGNGTYAPSAADYLKPAGGYVYRGEIGSGIYRIDPDGRQGPIQPFDVYCDMETAGGGWMLTYATQKMAADPNNLAVGAVRCNIYSDPNGKYLKSTEPPLYMSAYTMPASPQRLLWVAKDIRDNTVKWWETSVPSNILNNTQQTYQAITCYGKSQNASLSPTYYMEGSANFPKLAYFALTQGTSSCGSSPAVWGGCCYSQSDVESPTGVMMSSYAMDGAYESGVEGLYFQYWLYVK